MKLLSSDFPYRFRGAKTGKDGLFSPKFYVGIELEVENCHASTTHPNPSMFEAKGDGSLRNHGVEWISPPISGSLIESEINALWGGMPEKWSFSQRTSLHVHVNIQDFSYNELARLIVLYCACEPILFDYAGGDRNKNIFCTPLLESNYPSAYINTALQEDSLVIRGWEKYSALNLSRASDLGTAEFRHMPGTRDGKKVLMWVRILQAIYNAARKYTLDEIAALFAQNNEKVLMTAIFDPDIQSVFSAKDTRRLFRASIRDALLALKGEQERARLVNGRTGTSNFAKFRGIK